MFYMICDFIVIRNSLFFMTIVISDIFPAISLPRAFKLEITERDYVISSFQMFFGLTFWNLGAVSPSENSNVLATGSITGVSQLVLVWNLVLVLPLVRICWYNRIQFHHFFQVKIWFYVSELNILDDHKCFFMLVKYVPFPCLLCCDGKLLLVAKLL